MAPTDHDFQNQIGGPEGKPVQWDFSREGRAWRGAEFALKYSLVPGRIEAFDGRLCLVAEQRLTLLALLLENVGLNTVVQFGNPELWREALAARASELDRGLGKDSFNLPVMLSMTSGAAVTQEDVEASSSGSSWKYRVIEVVSGGNARSAIHKVYYENDEPRRVAEGAATVVWDSSEGAIAGLRVLERMKDSLFQPPFKGTDLGLSG